MTLGQVRELLDCKVLCGREHMQREVTSCFGADLMSDVLAFAKPHQLLLTGLNNAQSVRAADVMDFVAIVYVRGKSPNGETIELAKTKGIPLLVTDRAMVEACGELYTNGLGRSK